MLEARLDESGQAPVYGEQDEDRHREVHRGLTSPLPSTPLPTVTRLSMAPTPAVCPTLKAMLDLSLSVRTRPTSPTIPWLIVTFQRRASWTGEGFFLDIGLGIVGAFHRRLALQNPSECRVSRVSTSTASW